MADIMSIKNLFRQTGFTALLTKVQIPFKQKTLMEWKDKTLQDTMDECFTDPAAQGRHVSALDVLQRPGR